MQDNLSRFFSKVITCPYCGCSFMSPDSSLRILSNRRRCPNCHKVDKPDATCSAGPMSSLLIMLALIAALILVVLFSGCSKAEYDRGFKAGKKAGFKAGYSQGKAEGRRIGKTEGYAAGTATFVSGTLLPNLGLVITIVLLATATSWLSIHYIVPRHRAEQAKYNAAHTVEKTRLKLKQKHQISIQRDIRKVQANLKLNKHENSFRVKLNKLFNDASLLLLTESNQLVDELCNRQLRTINEISKAEDLTVEERILLYPAVVNELKPLAAKEKRNGEKKRT